MCLWADSISVVIVASSFSSTAIQCTNGIRSIRFKLMKSIDWLNLAMDLQIFVTDWYKFLFLTRRASIGFLNRHVMLSMVLLLSTAPWRFFSCWLVNIPHAKQIECKGQFRPIKIEESGSGKVDVGFGCRTPGPEEVIL